MPRLLTFASPLCLPLQLRRAPPPRYLTCTRQPPHARRHAHIPPPPDVHPDLPQLPLEAAFRALGADAAADLAYIALPQDPPPPSTWPTVLSLLAEHHISGPNLSRLATRLSLPVLLSLDPCAVQEILHFLATDAYLPPADLARAVAQRPDLLRALPPLQSAHAALLAAGLQPRDLTHVLPRWPGLLLLPAARINRAVAFLSAAGLTVSQLRPLLRRAPWVLVLDVESDMVPAVTYLRDQLRAPLPQLVLAAPLLLGTPPAAMHAVLAFLDKGIGLRDRARDSTIRSFPPLLTCSVARTLTPAVSFLTDDLGLSRPDLARVVRAFPTVLTLDVDRDMRPVINYFRSRGVVNVARIVRRLPPILGFDLEGDIIPKMRYVEQQLGLSDYDILLFPGYFSYSLDKCIKPRTKYLQSLGQPVTHLGLNLVLALPDKDFCERVANTPQSQYKRFLHAYLKKKREQQQQRADTAQELLEGSLGDAESTADSANPSLPDASSWEKPQQNAQRRKRRFRATLSRMPWDELR